MRFHLFLRTIHFTMLPFSRINIQVDNTTWNNAPHRILNGLLSFLVAVAIIFELVAVLCEHIGFGTPVLLGMFFFVKRLVSNSLFMLSVLLSSGSLMLSVSNSFRVFLLFDISCCMFGLGWKHSSNLPTVLPPLLDGQTEARWWQRFFELNDSPFDRKGQQLRSLFSSWCLACSFLMADDCTKHHFQ